MPDLMRVRPVACWVSPSPPQIVACYMRTTKLKQYDVAPETLELLPDAVREFVISNVAGIHNAKESLLHND